MTLYSDSKYLVDAFNLGWTKTWQEEHFRTGKKNEVKNPDLWQTLLDLVRIHEVTFVWVRGHNGHAYNERCDTLATTFADSFLQEEEDASQRPE